MPKEIAPIQTVHNASVLLKSATLAIVLLGFAASTKSIAAPQAEQMTVRNAGSIYANCDNAFVLMLNGREIMRHNDAWNPPQPVTVTLKPGDVISARVSDFGGSFGFAFLYCSNDKTVFFSGNTNDWYEYVPADEFKWWQNSDLANVKSTPTYKVDNNDAVAAQLHFQSDVPCRNVIWGAPDKRTTYLLHIVKETELSKVRNP